MKSLSICWLLILTCCVWAETGTNVLSKLNQYVDDQKDTKMSAANKVLMLNAAATELGRANIYPRIDTIVTAAGTEAYSLEADAVGTLRGVYLKDSSDRVFLRVIDFQELASVEPPDGGAIRYAYINESGQLGVHFLPQLAETLIVSYYAYPAELTGPTDSTEWAVPDVYEDAAIRIAASKVLMRVQTEWANRARQQFYETGWADVERWKVSGGERKEVGDQP